MTTLCKIDSPHCFPRAQEVIVDGGVVVYPTDTLYGFGVDAHSPRAVRGLNLLKGRQGPLSIAVASLEMVEAYGEIHDDKREFVVSHLPGKVTLILKARPSDLAPELLGPNQTVGIRIPDHPFPIDLTRKLDAPITTTSVNRTGEPPLNDPDRIVQEFGDEVDLVVDDGPLPPSGGSAVYDLTGREITLRRDPS